MPIDPSSLWSAETPPTLLASRHHNTGEWLFPALPEHSPLASRHATVPVQGAGTVYSFTVIHPAPKTGQAPYALGYVDFDGPVRLFGRLEGKDRPAIGDRYVARPDNTFGYVFHALQD